MLNYKILQNPAIQTILPSLFRPVPNFKYERETIETLDGDFLDLDWYRGNPASSKLAIIVHGLEGNSQSAYIRSAVLKLSDIGYDVLAMNLRGCGGETNRLLSSYHSGKTEDLELVINYILQKNLYQEIDLVGYSIGGNIVLKYLGEKSTKLSPHIKKAVTFSVPIDLEASANILAQPDCAIYMKYFLKKLYKKLLLKKKFFAEQIDISGFKKIRTFHEFDHLYTAPYNGFKDEVDYWRQASSKPWLTKITIPVLFITAKDDPFLSSECYPVEEAKQNPNLKLVMTENGGHVGFWELYFQSFMPRVNFYHEKYMVDFLR